jgi:hypothetical protein
MGDFKQAFKTFRKSRFKRAFFIGNRQLNQYHHLRSSQSPGKALRLHLYGLAYLKSSICFLLLHCAFLVTPGHAKIVVLDYSAVTLSTLKLKCYKADRSMPKG